MHDIHPQSVAAVPAIIKGLREKGMNLKLMMRTIIFNKLLA